jgi:predicted dehydrogenase
MSHSPPLQIAIVGLGRWGSNLLRTFLALPEARVVALVEPNRQRLEEVGDRLAPGSAIARYSDWAEAIAQPGLEAVVVATPASTHYPIVRAALAAGLHVLCEKPLTLESASSAELCALAEAQGRQLMVDHTYLFHPAVQTGQRLVEQLGTLRYGYAARTNLGPVRPDADVFWDLAIHDVAILNAWIGAPPVSVAAWGQGWLQPALSDVGWLRLVYPQRAAAQPLEAVVQVSWANPDRQRRLGLVGDRGTLVLDESPLAPPLTLCRGHFQTQAYPFVPNGPQNEVVAVPSQGEPLAHMGRHFLDCVQRNQPSPISCGRVGTDLVRLMEAVAIAAATGQPQAV